MAEQEQTTEQVSGGVKYFFRELGKRPDVDRYTIEGGNVAFMYNGKLNNARMDNIFRSEDTNMFGTVCKGLITGTISGEASNVILIANSPKQLVDCIYGDLIKRSLGHLFDMALVVCPSGEFIIDFSAIVVSNDKIIDTVNPERDATNFVRKPSFAKANMDSLMHECSKSIDYLGKNPLTGDQGIIITLTVIKPDEEDETTCSMGAIKLIGIPSVGSNLSLMIVKKALDSEGPTDPVINNLANAIKKNYRPSLAEGEAEPNDLNLTLYNALSSQEHTSIVIVAEPGNKDIPDTNIFDLLKAQTVLNARVLVGSKEIYSKHIGRTEELNGIFAENRDFNKDKIIEMSKVMDDIISCDTEETTSPVKTGEESKLYISTSKRFQRLYEDARKKVQSYEKRLESLESVAEAQKTKIESLTESVNAKNEKIKTVTDKYVEKSEAAKKHKENASKIFERAKDMKLELTAIETNLKETLGQIGVTAEPEVEGTTVSGRCSLIAKSLLAKIEELMKKAEEPVETVVDRSGEVEELNGKIAELRTKVETLEASLEEKTVEIKAHQEEHEKEGARVKELEESGNTKTAEIEDLKTKLAELSESLRVANEEMTGLRDRPLGIPQEEVDKLRAEVTELNNKIAAMKSQEQEDGEHLKEKDAKISELNSKISQLEEEKTSLQAKSSETEDAVRNKEKEIVELKASGSEIQNELDTLKKLKEKLENEKAEVEKVLDAERKKVQGLEKEGKEATARNASAVSELNKKMDELRQGHKTELAKVTTQHGTETKGLKESLTAKDNELKAASAKISTLNTESTAHKEEISKLKASAEAAKVAETKLKGELEAKRKIVGDLEKKTKEQQEQISQLGVGKDKLEQLQKEKQNEIKKLTDEKQKLQAELGECKGKLADGEKRIVALEKDLLKAKQEAEGLSGKLEAAKKEGEASVSSLKKQFEEEKAQRQSASAREMEEKTKQIGALKLEITTLQGDKETAAAENTKLNASVKSSNDKLKGKEKEIEAGKAKIKELEKQLLTATEAQNKLNSKCETQEKDMAKQRERIAALEKEVAERERQKEQTQAELKKSVVQKENAEKENKKLEGLRAELASRKKELETSEAAHAKALADQKKKFVSIIISVAVSLSVVCLLVSSLVFAVTHKK